LDEHVASIFGVEEYAKQEISMKQVAIRAPTLKMEVTYSSKTSVNFQQTTPRYIPGDRNSSEPPL
jgi:hypothetical protein